MEETSRNVSSSFIAGGKLNDFTAVCVIEFSEKTPAATREWLLSRVQARRSRNGAELEARTVLDKSNNETILQIGASYKRLLEGAEYLGVKKKCKDGVVREFTLQDIDQFENIGDYFLSSAEVQWIIRHGLEKLHSADTIKLPGLPDITVCKGEAIIPRCVASGVISKFYALHNDEELKSLLKKWYASISVSSLKVQPIDKIRSYFGDTIALYFAFLGYYTMGLIVPALFGLFYYIWHSSKDIPDKSYATFAIFNLLWATLFLEGWKRKCSGFTYYWGTYGMKKFEEPRASFVGTIGRNAVTGRVELVYPKWKRSVKKYCVSGPVISIFLILAVATMLGYFWFEDWLNSKVDVSTTSGQLLQFVPSSLYAVVIVILNAIYRQVATLLNDWENHRLQSSHENNLILKLVMFDFINCFLSLFYIAFWLQDMARLRKHLAALLVTQQILGQILESIVPYLMWRKGKIISDLRKKDDKARSGDEDQSDMYVYEGTFDDYLELFLQFGYVFLFSSVYPLAAVWALLNNVIELRTDAFKLCTVYQRPFSRQTAGIGTWQITFEVMGVLGVITNTALVAMSTEAQSLFTDSSETSFILVFVAIEHVIIGIKLLLAFMIPDLPKWMEEELNREEYESRQALKQQRMLEYQKT
ncbi:anoctamin-10-like [Glandiceps talaboti]